ncbi:hypothetical protein DFP72DRAFT_881338 [Ephemerocybe angulata]|uniref:Fungal-type protein kinase domain-containing protein n=1 Tax=Ephemerocybe angulata TaxID=980116 RepID=A0A8H6I8B7_9AGAR|nr:hypothetical protein DFP72DRAFT_881338 [Tulosesus angulatus]
MGPNPSSQPRIHWTRARSRAAKAGSDPHVPSPPKRGKPVEKPDTTKPPTPIAQPSAEDISRDAEFKRLKAALMQELGEKVHVGSEEWTKSLYCDLVNQASLDRYLASESSGYKLDETGEGRWARIPRNPSEESALYQPVAAILSGILKYLGDQPRGNGVTREVVRSHDPKSTFRYEDLKDLCPDISIVATGPSFERAAAKDEYVVGIGYSNVASVVEVKRDQDLASATFNEAEQVSQLAFYCRNIFTKQPNRNFVRSMIVTENRVRVVHYDREGFWFTPLIDIHRDPHTFIRLVLGLGSANEQTLGLDTTVQWTVDSATGKKTSGTIAGLDAEGLPIVYQINMGHSPFVRPEIKSRGTTCWHAINPRNGQDVFVKDAWRLTNKTSEYAYLQVAQGIGGVVQMVSFQDDCATTKGYRPTGLVPETFKNKTKSRLIVHRHGKSIEHFTSRSQAIGALRDVIVAHRALLSKSIQNILLGPEDAPPGRRGVLIDLDMATWTFKDVSEQRAEAGVIIDVPSRAVLLWGLESECPPLHDHLDDLESFFYVLCHLTRRRDCAVANAQGPPCGGETLAIHSSTAFGSSFGQRLKKIFSPKKGASDSRRLRRTPGISTTSRRTTAPPAVVSIAPPTCPTPIAPIATAAPTPGIAAPVIIPSETAKVGTNLKRRLEPRKRAQRTRPETSLPQPIRRSARLNCS